MRRVLLIGLLVALAAPAAAYGHASISRSNPAPRERLERSPSRVEVDFDQAVKVFPNGIRVYDARGRDFARNVHSASGGHAIVALVPRLPKGAYTVRWQGLSGDGHVVRRCPQASAGASSRHRHPPWVLRDVEKQLSTPCLGRRDGAERLSGR